MQITVGHTPDADDAFMFYGIASGKVKSNLLRVNHVIADIETLNRKALNHELNVTAISAHAYCYLEDHVILKSGGSFGLNYGPIVIASKKRRNADLKHATIAIPGKMTSANLLLKLAIGNTFTEIESSFEAIPEAVLSGRVDAGLIIHEAQITYDRTKLDNILDLGEWWSQQTEGLPVPLGINVASKRSMQADHIREFGRLFSDSISYAMQNLDEAVDYAMQYGRGHAKQTITKFVKMYVNDLAIDMGPRGRKAMERMFAMARERGIIQNQAKELLVDVV